MTFSEDSIAHKIQRMIAESEHFDHVVMISDPGAHLAYLLDTVEHFVTLHQPSRVVLNFSSIASFYIARLLKSQGVEVLALASEELVIPHDQDSEVYRSVADVAKNNAEFFDMSVYPVANEAFFENARVLIIPTNESFSSDSGDIVVDMSHSQFVEDCVVKYGFSPDFMMGPAVEGERRINMEQRPIRPVFILS